MTAQHPEICPLSEKEVKAKATDRRGGNKTLFHIPLPFPRKGQLVPGPGPSHWGPASLLSLYGGRGNDGSRVFRRKRERNRRLQKPTWRWVTVRVSECWPHQSISPGSKLRYTKELQILCLYSRKSALSRGAWKGGNTLKANFK
nr:uncharacterized protein LOC101058445 [Pan troglodytes]